MAPTSDQEKSDRRQVRRLVVAAVAVGVLIAAVAVLAAVLLSRPGQAGTEDRFRGSEPPGKNLLPKFDLPRYDGGRLASAALEGQVVLLTLLDSQCTEACPILASVVARAVDRLGPIERAQVHAVALSADPAEDTPAAVRRFLAERRAGGRLDYLIGTEDELRPLWTELSVLPSLDTGQDSMHSAPLRVYDRDGVWVSTLHAGVDLTESNLLHDIRTTLALDARSDE